MASSQVLVKNNGSKTYTENWKGDEYTIPAGETIQMSKRDAAHFLGTYPGKDIEKRLDIEDLDSQILTTPATPEKKVYKCMLDDKEFDSQKKLDAYLDTKKSQVFKDSALEEKNKKGNK